MDPSHADLPPTTPVLIGVGEVSETLGSPAYAARSEAALAADAVRAAVADTGADPAAVVAALDAAAMTRSFEAMGFGSPLGTPTSYPWAVLRRVGASPAHVVHDALGGQTSQSLVNELCQAIADGEHRVALVMGADVTSTTRHFSRDEGAQRERPDFAEVAEGPAVVEAFSVEPRRDGTTTAMLVCRDLAGRRFLAVAAQDEALLALLSDEDVEPVGRSVHVRHVDHLNRVALTRATLDRLHPVRRPRLDRAFERVALARSAGRVGSRWRCCAPPSTDSRTPSSTRSPRPSWPTPPPTPCCCTAVPTTSARAWTSTRSAGAARSRPRPTGPPASRRAPTSTSPS